MRILASTGCQSIVSKVWIKHLTMDEASVLSLHWCSIVALRPRAPFHQDSRCQDSRSNRRFHRTPSTFSYDSATRRSACVFPKRIIVPQHLQCGGSVEVRNEVADDDEVSGLGITLLVPGIHVSALSSLMTQCTFALCSVLSSRILRRGALGHPRCAMIVEEWLRTE